MTRDSGFTLIELLLTTALIATVLSMALPVFSDAVDAQRTASAARYVAGRVFLARMEAVKRSTSVGLKFDAVGTDYAFTAYVDGNANGIRTLDIRTGVDRPLTDREQLAYNFSGVRFGLMPGVPDADGAPDSANGDGVRIGSARILTLGANGTATAGTLYVHGRQRQYAVRVFGVTGRTRVIRYDAKSRKYE
jgi:prepilin-type N-terminal cleavage/methylation domain-containing protein